ncbi:MAG: hypothetical protein RR850_16820 [Hafnia sp.]
MYRNVLIILDMKDDIDNDYVVLHKSKYIASSLNLNVFALHVMKETNLPWEIDGIVICPSPKLSKQKIHMQFNSISKYINMSGVSFSILVDNSVNSLKSFIEKNKIELVIMHESKTHEINMHGSQVDTIIIR